MGIYRPRHIFHFIPTIPASRYYSLTLLLLFFSKSLCSNSYHDHTRYNFQDGNPHTNCPKQTLLNYSPLDVFQSRPTSNSKYYNKGYNELDDKEYLFFQDVPSSFQKSTDRFPPETYKFYSDRTMSKYEQAKDKLLTNSDSHEEHQRKNEKDVQENDQRSEELSFLSSYGGSFSSRETTKKSHKTNRLKISQKRSKKNTFEEEDDDNDILSLQWESSPKPSRYFYGDNVKEGPMTNPPKSTQMKRGNFYPLNDNLLNKASESPALHHSSEVSNPFINAEDTENVSTTKKVQKNRQASIQLGPLRLKFPKKVGRRIKSSLSVAHHIFTNNYRENDNFNKNSNPYIQNECKSSVQPKRKEDVSEETMNNVESDDFFSNKIIDNQAQNNARQQILQTSVDNRSLVPKHTRKNKIKVKVETNTGQDMLYVESKVNNKLLHACIDTGASHTVMSLEAAIKCGLSKYMDTSVNGKVKGAGYANIVGVINKAKLKIGPILEVETRLTIIDSVYPSFIIGLDVMRRCKVDINFSKNILIFYDDNEENPRKNRKVEVPFIQKGKSLHSSSSPNKRDLPEDFVNMKDRGKERNRKHLHKNNNVKKSRKKFLSLPLHSNERNNANPFLFQRRKMQPQQYHDLSQRQSKLANSSNQNQGNNDFFYPGYTSGESAKVNEADDDSTETVNSEELKDNDIDVEDNEDEDQNSSEDGGENTDVSLAGI